MRLKLHSHCPGESIFVRQVFLPERFANPQAAGRRREPMSSLISKATDTLASVSNRAGLEIAVRRVRRSSKRKRIVYFLHIGKAAGSQVKQVLRQINASGEPIQMCPLSHDVFLEDLPEPSDYFFSIREPASRFYSGFYSRKRMGRPLNDVPWTDGERQAFADFEHANELAEALFEPGVEGMRALGAIKAIRHTAQDQIDWFVLVGEIFSVRPPVWVLRQEHLEADMAQLLARLGVGVRPEMRRDKVGAHSNDYSETPPLSEKARANLQRWYAQDYALYDAVETWMAQERAKG
jgi:hypothetical protein